MSVDHYFFLAENTVQPAFVLDWKARTFSYLNPAFRRLLAIESEAAPAASLRHFVAPEDRVYLKKKFEEFLQGTIDSLQVRIQGINGSDRWLRLTPIFLDRESQTMAAVVNEITEEVNNTESYKKYAHKKNSVLHMIAHDLRGPIGIAGTMNQYLSRKLNDPELKALVDTIAKINTQVVGIIEDLLNREFLETFDVVLVKIRIDVVKKMKEYMGEFEKNGYTANRTFVFTSSHPVIFAEVDEAKFIQIFNNLMSNALKFTRDNGRISLRIDLLEDSVLFAFSDDGIGIPADKQPHLFEKFTSARRKGLRGEPSVGLGMSIVKTLVDWHEGKIWIDSKENEGTTFYVEIPTVSPGD